MLLCGMLIPGCAPDDPNAGKEARSSVVLAAADQAEPQRPIPLKAPVSSGRVTPIAAVATGGGTPVLETVELEFDFGEAEPSEKIQHDFLIRNAGTGQLVLGRPTTSCGCTVANVGDSTLDPGEETRISATMNLSGRDGPIVKSITVTSNDPNKSTVVFKLKGLVISPVMFEPKAVSFGTIADDETHYRSLTLRATKDNIEFNIEDVRHNMIGFNVEVETITPRKEFKLTIFNPEPLAPKGYHGRFTVRTDHPSYTNLTFSVSAIVVGDLRVQPEKITLVAKNTPGAKTDIAFRVDPGRVKNFKLLSVEPPLEGVGVEITELSGKSSYLIKLKGLPYDMSLNGKAAILKTNIPGRPEIRVPFEVRQLGRAVPLAPLTIRPNRITLIENPNLAGSTTSAVFYVSAGKVTEFDLKEVVVPVEGVTIELKKIRDNYWLVKLSGLPQDMTLNGKSVIVRTDGPEVKVPIVVRSAAGPVRTIRPAPIVRPGTRVTVTPVRVPPVPQP